MTRTVLAATMLLSGVIAAAPSPVRSQAPAGGQQRDYKKEIGVSDAQDTKIQAINLKYQDKAQPILLQIRQLPVQANKEYEALLTPDQLKKAKAIQVKYKAKQAAMEKQLQNLQIQGNKEVEAVFTAAQLKKIQQLQREELQAMQAQQGNAPSQKR